MGMNLNGGDQPGRHRRPTLGSESDAALQVEVLALRQQLRHRAATSLADRMILAASAADGRLGPCSWCSRPRFSAGTGRWSTVAGPPLVAGAVPVVRSCRLSAGSWR